MHEQLELCSPDEDPSGFSTTEYFKHLVNLDNADEQRRSEVLRERTAKRLNEEKADKEMADKEKADKEKADKEKADKEKKAAEKVAKDKLDKDKGLAKTLPSTPFSSGASSSSSFPVSASTPLASGAVSSSSTVFGSTPAAFGAPGSFPPFGSSTPFSSGASSSASFPVSASTPLALGAISSSSASFGSMPSTAAVVSVSVFHALQDERTLAECLRTQLGLTPHRASKLKARLVHWAHCGVSLQDGSLVALSPSLTLDLLLHPMQTTLEPVVDDSVLKDILAAMRKAQFRSLGELGLFKTAPAPAPAPAPAVQQGHAAAGIDASCVLVSALLLQRLSYTGRARGESK